MRMGQPERDPRETALRQRLDPRMAALESLANGDDEGYEDTLNPTDARPILEDEVALPGGGQMPIDDLEERGELTPDLLRKARPDVWRHMEALRAAGPGPADAPPKDMSQLPPENEYQRQARALGLDPRGHRR